MDKRTRILQMKMWLESKKEVGLEKPYNFVLEYKGKKGWEVQSTFLNYQDALDIFDLEVTELLVGNIEPDVVAFRLKVERN